MLALMGLPSMDPNGIRAQSQIEAQAPLTFDVASVKPGAPGGRGGIIRSLPGNQTYHAENVPLRVLMTVAYTVTDRQISGGPSWISTDRFDIEAKAARPGTIDELHLMLQHLLEDRFHLKLRHETREQAVWVLTVDKGGSKMPVHDVTDKDYPPMALTARGHLTGSNATMNYFAFVLSRMMDRTVIDKTGLPARYDVNLEWTPDDSPSGPDGAASAANSDGPTIFAALPKQLGLRLESARGPVEFLVIEHAEKPTEN
jgi:uncharacterized protein (TIGR03435 family)